MLLSSIELRSRTLASIKPEISQALDGLLEEVSSTSGRAMRTRTFPTKKKVFDSQSKRLCPFRKQAGKVNTKHFLSQCRHLLESDKLFLMKA